MMSQAIPVLFRNRDFIAVDKPPGLSVHNDEPGENLIEIMSRDGDQVYPVHRLDRETSGVQILALNENSARTLATQFQEHIVEKFYVGVLRGGGLSEEGLWLAALSDSSEGRVNPAGKAENRKSCETRFKVLQKNKYFTLCRFQLITGRQHQIRKHAALAKHALVGDARYGDGAYNSKMAAIYKTERMFLHCCELSILGNRVESPTPEIFSKLFAEG